MKYANRKVVDTKSSLNTPGGVVVAGVAIRVLIAGTVYSGGKVIGFNSDGNIVYRDTYAWLEHVALPEDVKMVGEWKGE